MQWGDDVERLTRRDLADVNGRQIVLCDSKEEDCNDSCLYRRCKWNEKALRKLKEYEDAEEQGMLLRLPCRLGDIIDRIISHNETVTLMFETEVSSFRGLQHFWHGAAWNIPKEYLELPFVKIHGVVPDKITEADTIWIEVRKEAEQALARMEKKNVQRNFI